MHEEAELGVCSHLTIKKGGKNTDPLLTIVYIHCVRYLEHYQERNDANVHKSDEDSENFEQIQDFEDFEKIYVFSRDGDIKELPRGSTVLDFAYHVHAPSR